MLDGINLDSPKLSKKLKAYVYRLVDPRNFETFYVGKGKASRVQRHAKGVVTKRGRADDLKLKRIRDIRRTTHDDPIAIIHRHGLTDEAALEVEAALMDAYPGLTNKIGGSRADGRAVSVDEFIEKHAAPVAKFRKKEPCLAVVISRSAARGYKPYDAARFCWPLRERKAKTVKYVLAVDHGLIVGVFEPTKWMRAKDITPPRGRRVTRRNRNYWAFVGHPAPKDVLNRYKDHRIPRKPGDRSRFRYLP